MSIYKHPKSDQWWMDFTTPNGQRVRRSTGTSDRKAAQELHDRLKAEMWRAAKLGEVPDRTFDDAALEFLKASEGQSDYNTKVRHIIYWRSHFGGKPIRSLTAEIIRAALPTHSAYSDKRAQRKLSNATINRYIATITRVMNVAVESGWISSVPVIKLRNEGGIRIRFLTQEQARHLVQSISQDWMRHLVVFARGTGMRQGEIMHLKWADVNLSNRMCWVKAENAKSGHARAVPLNDEMLALLQSLVGNHKEYVFTRCGHEVKFFDQLMFQRDCRRAQIDGFRFHDLRHTWASWHAQAGTPLTKLQALGGWRTIQMVMRYAHLSPVHLSEHVGAVQFLSNGMFTAHQEPKRLTPPGGVALVA